MNSRPIHSLFCAFAIGVLIASITVVIFATVGGFGP